MRFVSCAVSLALALVACDRGHARDQATRGAASPPTAAAPAPAPTCTLPAIPLRRPAPRRLVAIGDLHGDLDGARAALRTAGAIDDHDHWRGGDLVVVQTGDVLDRGDDDRALLELIARLEAEAAAAGGAFILLLGNHELMNAAGDFRYVTPGGFRAFDELTDLPLARAAGFAAHARHRAAAFVPGAPFARQLARHAVIAIVGDTVFSHAGVLGAWVRRVEEVNQASRCWLDGQGADPPPALTFDDSPVWTRAAGRPSTDCAEVAAALDALGARRMVVGHTVQPDGITAGCDDTVWRIDVGLARHYGGPIQVLELSPGAPPKILVGAR